MENFETLLIRHKGAVERYVRFKLPSQTDAEDVLQDVYLTAFQKFSHLREESAFKAWLVSIARNKCSDYFRARGKREEIPLEEAPQSALSYGRAGWVCASPVEDTMERLSQRECEILRLYFWEELSQADIARRLDIPVGTVKSRLHTAKERFKANYPYHPRMPKGVLNMRKLPAVMPEYIIEATDLVPFPVKWEELMGWFLVPRLGEKLSWGMYDIPSRRCSHIYDMNVAGRAVVHGIEGVEVTARETEYSNREEVIERTFVVQLTDAHCRYLATLRNEDGVRNYITFLDEDEFMSVWGFGENNCGNETNLLPKGEIRREGAVVVCQEKDFLLDIVGRYTVTINGKHFDTVCLMIADSYDSGTISEQYLDEHGRTVLWRRFNRDDWAVDHFDGKPWSQRLPNNERIAVNGKTYVHWYDCITDYIL